NAGRVRFVGPEANLGAAIRRYDAAPRLANDHKPSWQKAIANARLPLYDVHWSAAIIIEKPSGKRGESWKVGLADGRIMSLSIDNGTAAKKLTVHDVVFVKVVESKGKAAARAE